MTTAEMMAEIVGVMGQVEGRRLVMEAYNTEIICNRLGRLEERDKGTALTREKRDLLELAVQRTHRVVTFGH
jgi:hypothetical protein